MERLPNGSNQATLQKGGGHPNNTRVGACMVSCHRKHKECWIDRNMTSYSSEGSPSTWPGFLPRLRLEVTGHGPHPFFDRAVYPRLFYVGRSPDIDGQLDDPERYLSMRHFVIEVHGSEHRLRNVSVNGTTVNGDRLDDTVTEHVLKDGDVILAGRIKIKVHIEPGPFEKLLDADGDWITSLRNGQSNLGDQF